MSFLDLQNLWKLHQIDRNILTIRRNAANLDIGQSLQAQIQKIQAEADEVGAEYKALSAEQTDLELARKGWEDKIKKFETDLYSGKITNPREVENIQKEVTHLKAQLSQSEDRALELMELVPVAKKPVETLYAQIDKLKADILVKQKEALKQKSVIEEQFKSETAKRAPAANNVLPALLTRYDTIRQKHGGVGMVTPIKGHNCSECGTTLPTKSIDLAKDGKVVTCESCHRIIFASDGLV